MSYGGGYKRQRPEDFATGYDRGISYGPPGDFGPPMGAVPGTGLEAALPSVGIGVGLGVGLGLGTGPSGQMPVVKLRGLPFTCDEEEVKLFLELDTVDIVFVKRQGRFSGEAFVVLPGMIQVELALGKHKAYMGKRYVEVQSALKEDYYRAVAAAVADGGSHGAAGARRDPFERSGNYIPSLALNGTGSPSILPRGTLRDGLSPGDFARGGLSSALDRQPPLLGLNGSGRDTSILRLRGLPFSASREEVAVWFNTSGVLNRPLDESSVHLVLAFDGRPTGSAFVEFSNPQEAQNAMARDKEMMGSRYVEIFPSSRHEVSHATGGAY